MRLLIVDDSKAMRMIVRREVSKVMEVDCFEAESPAAAVEVMAKEPVDMLLCDWNMPGMTGIEFLELLQSKKWKGSLGFVTSESGESVRRRATQAGAVFLIKKPFTGEQLGAAIQGALKGKRIGLTDAAPENADSLSTIGNALQGLFGAPVTVAPGGEPPMGTVRYLVRYTDGTNTEVAACLAEIAIAASLGGALTQVSGELVSQAISSGKLGDPLFQNFCEVANVLSGVLSSSKRCVLKTIEVVGSFAKPPIPAHLLSSGRMARMQLSVTGYRSGAITFFFAA
jgi:two-component system chemotaxis response regulator CheY